MQTPCASHRAARLHASQQLTGRHAARPASSSSRCWATPPQAQERAATDTVAHAGAPLQASRRAACLSLLAAPAASLLLPARAARAEGEDGAAALADATEALLPRTAPTPAAAPPALPKGYRDTSTKLVQTLKESVLLDIQGAEERELRRTADPAKELVKEWITRWRDDASVQGEVSHREISATLQELGGFYQRRGARARLPKDLGESLLARLQAAEDALPAPPESPSLIDKLLLGK